MIGAHVHAKYCTSREVERAICLGGIWSAGEGFSQIVKSLDSDSSVVCVVISPRCRDNLRVNVIVLRGRLVCEG